MLALQAPALYFTVHDDGTLAHVGLWVEHMLVSNDLLARADGWRVVLGDGFVTFLCTNGGARYALSDSTMPGVHLGRRVESWE